MGARHGRPCHLPREKRIGKSTLIEEFAARSAARFISIEGLAPRKRMTALDRINRARLRRTEAAERAARDEAERTMRAGMGDKAGERKVIGIGSQELALRWCPPGTFTMGSPSSEDETQHRVTLTNIKKGDNYPVESVSWKDCNKFVKVLNSRYAQQGLRWAMPTEAQWAYVWCAGDTGSLDDRGWYSKNSGNSTHPVAQKKANAWGLYDMCGNVWEWCSDWYGDYPSGAVTDPTGLSSGLLRVFRGGSWDSFFHNCRSASRVSDSPGDRNDRLGFRVALVPAD